VGVGDTIETIKCLRLSRWNSFIDVECKSTVDVEIVRSEYYY